MIMGRGPSKSLVSFFNLSIVSGKQSSRRDTTGFARSKIRECDRKFFVSWSTFGTWKLP